MPRRRAWRAALAGLLVLFLSWGASGCGVKGNPKAPKAPIIPGL